MTAKRTQEPLLTQVLKLKTELDQVETWLELIEKVLVEKRSQPELDYAAGEALVQGLNDMTLKLQELTEKLKGFDNAELAAKLAEVRKTQEEAKSSLQQSVSAKQVDTLQSKKERLEVLVDSDKRAWGLYLLLAVVCIILLQTWYTLYRSTKTKLP